MPLVPFDDVPTFRAEGGRPIISNDLTLTPPPPVPPEVITFLVVIALAAAALVAFAVRRRKRIAAAADSALVGTLASGVRLSRAIKQRRDRLARRVIERAEK
jgi:MYXO-CTERM domain-containing protein